MAEPRTFDPKVPADALELLFAVIQQKNVQFSLQEAGAVNTAFQTLLPLVQPKPPEG